MSARIPNERTSRRTSRATEIIAHEAAVFIKDIASPESLITVTHALPFSHGERMTVYVSVFPEAREEAACALLARKREAFSDYLKVHVRIKPLPRVDFEIDHGEKHRRHLDELGG